MSAGRDHSAHFLFFSLKLGVESENRNIKSLWRRSRSLRTAAVKVMSDRAGDLIPSDPSRSGTRVRGSTHTITHLCAVKNELRGDWLVFTHIEF